MFSSTNNVLVSKIRLDPPGEVAAAAAFAFTATKGHMLQLRALHDVEVHRALRLQGLQGCRFTLREAQPNCNHGVLLQNLWQRRVVQPSVS